MAKRRPAGDGLVRKRADGRWEGRIVVGHKEDGSPIFRSIFAHTQKEVVRKLHSQIETYRDVELTEESNMTLGERLIVKNPTEGTVIPKNNYPPKQILTEEQLEIFLEVAKADPVWSDFFYTELTTGLRLGEICGLKWQDFEEKTGRLHIRRSVHRRKGGGVRVGETKTETGTRTILLPPSTMEILKARKKKSYSDWIFHNPVVPEVPMDPSTAYHRLKTLLRHAELPPIRFHDLRHTFATHALTSGVDAKTLSTILGHTNASFTLDTYTHMTTDMHRKAATVVGGFLDEIM